MSEKMKTNPIDRKLHNLKIAHRRASEPLGLKNHGDTGRSIPPIDLYQTEESPICQNVRALLSDLGLDYVVHTVPVNQPLKAEKLLHIGGKNEVPFLFDHQFGVKLYGPSAICAYLESEYGPLKSNTWSNTLLVFSHKVESRKNQIAWALRRPVEKARRMKRDLYMTWNSFGSSIRDIRKILAQEWKTADSKLRSAVNQDNA